MQHIAEHWSSNPVHGNQTWKNGDHADLYLLQQNKTGTLDTAGVANRTQRRSTEGHARTILSLDDENEREEFAKEIVEKGYSVRECERIVKERKNNISNDSNTNNNEENTENQNEVKKENKKDPNIKKLENDLEKIFSTKVNVIDKNGKEGKIVIEYYSSDDLSRIMDMLEKIYERETGIKPTLEY